MTKYTVFVGNVGDVLPSGLIRHYRRIDLMLGDKVIANFAVHNLNAANKPEELEIARLVAGLLNGEIDNRP